MEAQSALASLQEIDASVSGDQSSADGIARTLLDLTNEIDARIAGDTRLLTTSLSIDLRYWLKLSWQNFGDSLLVSARELTQHATSLEQQLARLDQLNKTWQATLQSAKQPDTPPPVLQNVQSVVDSVERTRQGGRIHPSACFDLAEPPFRGGGPCKNSSVFNRAGRNPVIENSFCQRQPTYLEP